MSDDPRPRLREALAEAAHRPFCLYRSTRECLGPETNDRLIADAILAALPEHRDDVLALMGMGVVQRSEYERMRRVADEQHAKHMSALIEVAALRAENERLTEALRKVEYLGSQAQTNAAVHMGMIARASLAASPPTETTKAQRHQEHYRTCGCLGDSDVCCDPLCCAEPAGEVAHDR